MSAIDSHEASLDALAAAQEHAAGMRRACEQLLERFQAMNTPAIHEVVALSATEPVQRLEAGRAARSIGIYNPSPSIVFMGYDGGKPSAEARAWSVPPGSMLVLPILAEDLEFGAEADLLADGDVVFHVLRFHFVQPPFFAR